MAKILFLDFRENGSRLLNDKKHDKEFKETSWVSGITESLVPPPDCRIVFYQMDPLSPGNGLHAGDAKNFEKIVKDGGAIVSFMGHGEEYHLTNIIGSIPRLKFEGNEFPDKISWPKEKPFNFLFSEYGPFIQYAAEIFPEDLGMDQKIDLATWDSGYQGEMEILAQSYRNRPVAALIRHEKGIYLLLPSFGEKNVEVTEWLLNKSLPELAPHLFVTESSEKSPESPEPAPQFLVEKSTESLEAASQLVAEKSIEGPEAAPLSFDEEGQEKSMESTEWMDSYEYYFPHLKEIFQQIEEETEKYRKTVDGLRAKIEDIRKNEQEPYNKLLKAQGEEFKQAVLNALKYLGWKNVIDVDSYWKHVIHIKEEDIWLLDENDQGSLEEKIRKDQLLLVVVRSGESAAPDNDCDALQKYKGRRMQEFSNTKMKAVLLGNYFCKTEPKSRQNPFSPNQMEDAVKDLNGLLATYELFKAIKAEKENKISKEQIRNQIKSKAGLIVFEYPKPS